MVIDKLNSLKKEKEFLKSILLKESIGNEDAKYLYNELESYFDEVDVMQVYSTLGRIRYEKFIMESSLSKNIELVNSYSRFANLLEGVFL